MADQEDSAAPTEIAIQTRRAEIAAAQLDHQHFQADALTRLGSIDELARSALRGLTLGNGGAIIALFTFIGNDGATERYDASLIWWAFAAFIAGLVVIFGSTVAGYVCQSRYMQSSVEQSWNAQKVMTGVGADYDHNKTHASGERWERIALGGVAGSLLAFAAGSLFALMGVLP